MNEEIVKVEVLTRKVHYGSVMSPGELVDAKLQPDGVARPVKKPYFKLKPHEYRVFIPEQEFEKLLKG